MARYAIKVYKGCPVHSVCWNVISLIGFACGICGFLSLYYVFFPDTNTNSDFVLQTAVVGIPGFILCMIARKLVDRSAAKKQAQQSQKQ